MFVPNFEELHTLITELADEQARLKNESDNIHKLIDQIHHIFENSNIDEMNACCQYMTNVASDINNFSALFEEMTKKFQEVFDTYYYPPESTTYFGKGKFD